MKDKAAVNHYVLSEFGAGSNSLLATITPGFDDTHFDQETGWDVYDHVDQIVGDWQDIYAGIDDMAGVWDA